MASELNTYRGVTGGMYKALKHVHRCVADQRLLAIPTSCRRVAAYNPNLDQVLRLANFHKLATVCLDHCSTLVALSMRGMLT